MSAIMDNPSEDALKFPATKPERMFNDAPPSSDDVTTSRTCAECMEVKTFTNSGIIAPASVPQVITEESFHHNVVSPPRPGIIGRETRKNKIMKPSKTTHPPV